MRGVIFGPNGGAPRPLTRDPTGDGGERETWLQELLSDHPALVPLDEIDPGAGAFIPVCRELQLPGAGGTVSLDIFGLTPAGRPVLVECKLWRNPEARRKVVGQILEYAGLLQRWTYGELSAQVARRLGKRGDTALVEAVRQHHPGLDEARFVDAVSTCLSRGDFDLIIAGDGIRADLQAIAGYIGNRTVARLALVEYRTWTDPTGARVILPAIPFRTEVVTQRVLVDQGGRALQVEEPGETEAAVEGVANPVAASNRAANRAFWDAFIKQARFDNTDQPPPRHGMNNWVRIDLPAPARMTAFRTDGSAGVFVTLTGETAATVYDRFLAEQAQLEAEITEGLKFKPTAGKAGEYTILARHRFDTGNAATEDAQRRWLLDTANRFVTALRPRLGHGVS